MDFGHNQVACAIIGIAMQTIRYCVGLYHSASQCYHSASYSLRVTRSGHCQQKRTDVRL